MKRGLNTGSSCPGIHIVTHTVWHNGAANKKLKFPSTSSILFLQGVPRVEGKTRELKSKPVSATNAALTHAPGLPLCSMSRSYNTGTFQILKQPNGEEMCYYLLHSPEGAEHERGRGLMFSEGNKRWAGKKLALQTKRSMLRSSRCKRAFENGPGVFQREAVFGGTRKEKDAEKNADQVLMWCFF